MFQEMYNKDFCVISFKYISTVFFLYLYGKYFGLCRQKNWSGFCFNENLSVMSEISYNTKFSSVSISLLVFLQLRFLFKQMLTRITAIF